MQSRISKLVDCYERGQISRRSLILSLTALFTAAKPAEASTFKGGGLNHIALGVSDIQRSKAFYQEHFGLDLIRESPSSCFLDLGPHFLALFRSTNPGLHHYCIAIEGFAAGSAVEELQTRGLSPRRSGNRVYFDDPDGIEVQVSSIGHRA